ncbi:Sodium- And Chloride-Dependent Glycine Transporter 1 [Manis pentadactyla]|nr:Sodium- And Chloride-Dependent Glycine Transporter 1 [Manis pentadactyla]
MTEWLQLRLSCLWTSSVLTTPLSEEFSPSGEQQDSVLRALCKPTRRWGAVTLSLRTCVLQTDRKRRDRVWKL